MSDIVKRLRHAPSIHHLGDDESVMDEVADEIERLRGAMAADDKRLADAAARVGCEDFGCDAADHMADKIIGQKAEIERLRDALEFYANEAAWENVRVVEHGITRYEQCQACDDAGHTARTALNPPRREE